MKIGSRLAGWMFAVVVLALPALPARAVLGCWTACLDNPCCSQRCWDNGSWTTCGGDGYACNGACRAEPASDAKDEAVATRDAALLRALLPDVCSAAPETDATPLVPIS